MLEIWECNPSCMFIKQNKLTKKFRIQGIPSLVLIDGITGKLISNDGRNNILDDPEGTSFPWYPKPLSDILQGELKLESKEIDCQQALHGKVKGLYFSAHWVS